MNRHSLQDLSQFLTQSLSRTTHFRIGLKFRREGAAIMTRTNGFRSVISGERNFRRLSSVVRTVEAEIQIDSQRSLAVFLPPHLRERGKSRCHRDKTRHVDVARAHMPPPHIMTDMNKRNINRKEPLSLHFFSCGLFVCW